MLRRVLPSLMLVGVFASVAIADVPTFVNVQGKLTDVSGNPLPAGSKTFQFRIFDDTAGGAQIWPDIGLEQQTISSDAAGLWSARIGVVLPLLPSTFNSPFRWLQINVNGTTLPMIRLVTVPFSFTTGTVDGASGGAIDGSVSVGGLNISGGLSSFVAGDDNVVTGDFASISGGRNNTATGTSSHIGAGEDNTASGTGSMIGGGVNNRARGAYSFVGGGGSADPSDSNTATGNNSVIGGGLSNLAGSSRTTIAGGESNSATGVFAAIGGGSNNTANNQSATIAGGSVNLSSGFASTVGGGQSDTASNNYATVSGGTNNVASGNSSTIGGGGDNRATAGGTTIAGGSLNLASNLWATIGGGFRDTASNEYSTVSGGFGNRASGRSSVIGGGSTNVAADIYSTVGGGLSNTASEAHACVPGGGHNRAVGGASFAAGFAARANHLGSFVWNSGSNSVDSFGTSANNQFLIRASGGVGVGTNSTPAQLNIYEPGESTTQTNLTQALLSAGVNIITDYTVNAYTPGVFWSTQNNNADNPKAGIYLRETAAGSEMRLGTSNNYATGITNDALTIDPGGNVGVGITAPEGPVHIQNGSAGTVTANGNSIAVFESSTSGGWLSVLGPDNQERGLLFTEPSSAVAGAIVFDQGGGGNDLGFRTGGNVTNMTLDASGNLTVVGCVDGNNTACASDRRFKTDIATLKDPIATVQQLRGINFRWRQREFPLRHFDSGEQMGLIAQEVQEVLPGAVREREDGYLSVEYSELIPLLLEAVKEQQRQIDELKKRLDRQTP